MKTLISFTKKEFKEHIRSARFFIVLGVFVLLGILSPLLAKLTPELIAMLSESQASNGMEITVGTVTAMDSWIQYFKNMPIALIVFILLESNLFTKEYQSSTLVLALTKGLKRYKVIMAKGTVMAVLWSVGMWLCFFITYGINAYLWDNSVADNLLFSALCWWLLGIFAVCLTVIFSTIAKTNIVVLAGTGGVIFGSYLLGLLPKIAEYTPSLLMDGTSLIYSVKSPEDYVASIVITVALSILCIVASVPLFNKKAI